MSFNRPKTTVQLFVTPRIDKFFVLPNQNKDFYLLDSGGIEYIELIELAFVQVIEE